VKQFLKSTEEHLDLDGLTGYQRKLLYDNLNTRVETPLELETVRSPSGSRVLRVARALSGPEREARLAQRLEERLEEAAGFSRVIQAISESGKPVVGHNMLLDLLHITHQFVCPLPESYSEFKSLLHCVFPRLVDTKVMASTAPFRDLVPSTGLGHLATCLAVHPFSMPTIVAAEGSRGPVYQLHDNKHHQAGYDAFLTASCFAAMCCHLGRLMRPPQTLLDPVTAELVKPFFNKIFATRMADVSYLNLTADDVTPSRHHVFHMSFTSRTWRTPDIERLFSPYSRVQVQWQDDTSAFVALERRDQSTQVVQNVRAAGTFTLSTYVDWQTQRRKSQAAGSGQPRQAVESTGSTDSSPAAATTTGSGRTLGVPSRTPGAPARSPGAPARTPGTPARTPGTPARTLGTPARSPGAPARTPGTPARTPAVAAKTASPAVNGAGARAPKPSSGKKRKRQSSGTEETAESDPDGTATPANNISDIFTVPDWS